MPRDIPVANAFEDDFPKALVCVSLPMVCTANSLRTLGNTAIPSRARIWTFLAGASSLVKNSKIRKLTAPQQIHLCKNCFVPRVRKIAYRAQILQTNTLTVLQVVGHSWHDLRNPPHEDERTLPGKTPPISHIEMRSP